MECITHNVLPKIDSIKTKISPNEDVGGFIEKCGEFGFPEIENKWLFLDNDYINKNGIYVGVTTVVLSASFEYYAVSMYSIAAGFPINVSNDLFLEILKQTSEQNNGYSLCWKNLYGYYLHPKIYNRD